MVADRPGNSRQQHVKESNSEHVASTSRESTDD